MQLCVSFKYYCKYYYHIFIKILLKRLFKTIDFIVFYWYIYIVKKSLSYIIKDKHILQLDELKRIKFNV